jgi:hypothetical protein
VSGEAEIRALAEAVADVLLERGLLSVPEPRAARIMDATQVAEMLGRDRHWVYAHARELGAFRFGDGPKARLGFDAAAIERWTRRRALYKESSKAEPRRGRRPPRASTGGLIPYESA